MEKKNKYSFEQLKNYSFWYYNRYFPSNQKLLEKLQEKGREDDAQKIYSEMKPFLQEDSILKSVVESYIAKNKNYRYIQQKLREKKFPLEKIHMYLEPYKISGESLLSKDFLRNKIENYIQKWKSRRYIEQKLWETAADRENLTETFEQYFWNTENEAILKEYSKLEPKYPRPKIIQKLLAKWFRYDDIKKTLEF